MIMQLDLNITYNREMKELRVKDNVLSPVEIDEIGEALQEYVDNYIKPYWYNV